MVPKVIYLNQSLRCSDPYLTASSEDVIVISNNEDSEIIPTSDVDCLFVGCMDGGLGIAARSRRMEFWALISSSPASN